MCLSAGAPAPPPAPAPLSPAPVPPPAPPAPLPTPAPEAVGDKEVGVNPQVRRAKSQKAKGEYAKGSSQLRVPLAPKVNTGQTGPAGGLNK